MLDTRLAAVDLAALAGAARLGIGVLALMPEAAPTPYGMSTLDLTGTGACRLSRAGRPVQAGEVESVSTGYVRDLAEQLPDA